MINFICSRIQDVEGRNKAVFELLAFQSSLSAQLEFLLLIAIILPFSHSP